MERRIVSLPDGRQANMTMSQARRVWQIWLVLAPIAAARGEGVSVSVEDETVEISTVYAPQWEGVWISVGPDGSAEWCSEQSAAPDLPVDFGAPPPLGPWERAEVLPLSEARLDEIESGPSEEESETRWIVACLQVKEFDDLPLRVEPLFEMPGVDRSYASAWRRHPAEPGAHGTRSRRSSQSAAVPIGVGAGDSGGDPLNAGQRMDTLLGKMLRIDVGTDDATYRIPPENPFFTGGEGDVRPLLPPIEERPGHVLIQVAPGDVRYLPEGELPALLQQLARDAMRECLTLLAADPASREAEARAWYAVRCLPDDPVARMLATMLELPRASEGARALMIEDMIRALPAPRGDER